MFIEDEDIEDQKADRIRKIIIATISAIMLLIFVTPMLVNIYRGLQPPPPILPTPNSDPTF